MTEQGKKADAWPEGEITFSGRVMKVRMPEPAQILVWKRTLAQLERMGSGDWGADQVMSALERARKIIDSVLISPEDIDWLDDALLDRTVTLVESAQIIQLSVEAFGEKANREERRATKKAARKKASA